MPSQVVDAYASPKGYSQLTSLSSAAGLTVPDGSNFAIIIAETQDVRWRDDGTNPSATVGMLLPKNTVLIYSGNLKAVKFIETTASAVLNVSFYK